RNFCAGRRRSRSRSVFPERVIALSGNTTGPESPRRALIQALPYSVYAFARAACAKLVTPSSVGADLVSARSAPAPSSREDTRSSPTWLRGLLDGCALLLDLPLNLTDTRRDGIVDIDRRKVAASSVYFVILSTTTFGFHERT